MNSTNENKKMSVKSLFKLLSIVLSAVFIGRVGTAYIVGKDSDLSLFFTFAGVALVSFLLSFFIVSPKLKKLPINKFLTFVIPLTLVFMLVFGFVLF